MARLALPAPVRNAPILALLAAALTACERAEPVESRVVSEYMRTLYGAIRAERLSPPVASRLMVYATSALYSGAAAADPDMRPLGPEQLNGFPELPAAAPDVSYDATIVAAAAERVVIDSLMREALPTTLAALRQLGDSIIASRSSAGVDSTTRMISVAHGSAIGLRIVAWSRQDGFDGTRGRKYEAPTGPGLWVNDAPANIYASQNLSGASEFVALDNPANLLQAGKVSDRSLVLNRPKKGTATMPAVNMSGMSEPYWSELRPFGLARWDECVIPPPPLYESDSLTLLYQNARAVVSAGRALTPDQRIIALYWADNAGESGTPVGHWISIASQMIAQKSLDGREALRITLATAVAQADAFISSWGYKYRYNLLRPRTYIRAHMDSTWEPLIPTPPFPEYPSGHSTQSAAAAEVLATLIGDEPFVDSTSISIGHAARAFTSFRAAAEEAGMSRIYGGIHYPIANTVGRDLGQCVGQRVLRRIGAKPAT